MNCERSRSCFRALLIMRGPAAEAKLPGDVWNPCVLLARQSPFSFQRTQGTTGGCYPHACQFFFPHPIQLSPIALLVLLHLLSAGLRGDTSLIREASPPECRTWQESFLTQITREGLKQESSIRAQTWALTIRLNLLDILINTQAAECLTHMPVSLVSKMWFTVLEKS